MVLREVLVAVGVLNSLARAALCERLGRALAVDDVVGATVLG